MLLILWSITGSAGLYIYVKDIRVTGQVYVQCHTRDSGIEIFGITPTKKLLPLDQDSCLSRSRHYYGLWNGFAVSTDTTLIRPDDRLTFVTEKGVRLVQAGHMAETWKMKAYGERRVLFISPDNFFPEIPFPDKLRAAVFSVWPFQIFLLLPVLSALFIAFRFRIRKFLSRLASGLVSYFSRRKFSPAHILASSWKPALLSSFITVIIFLSGIYGYMFFRFGMSGFMTFVIALFWLVFLILLPFYFLRRRLLPCTRKRATRFMVFFALLLCITEGGFRISGRYYTFNEKQGDFYKSGFNTNYLLKETPWLRYAPGPDSGSYNRTEFDYRYYINTDGLRDRAHDMRKSPGTFRILCMGNSFTEGIGTTQDSTWPALLENLMNRGDDSIRFEVMNAGVASNDLFFQLPLYKNLLRKYKPDHIILAAGPIEFTFFRYRGGLERYTMEGVRFRRAPAWEGLYAISHSFRFIVSQLFGYDHTFQNVKDKLEMQIQALPQFRAAADSLGSLARHDGAGFSLLVFPEISTYCCENRDYFLMLSEFRKSRKYNTFDLYSYFAETEKISNTNFMRYYWPLDGHPRPRGYAAFARGARQFLISELPQFSDQWLSPVDSGISARSKTPE